MLIITRKDIKSEFRGKVDRGTIQLHHLKEEMQDKIRKNKQLPYPKTVYYQVITVTNQAVTNLN